MAPALTGVVQGTISAATYAATELVNNREVDGATLATEATLGAVFNLLSFGTAGGSAAKTTGKLLDNMWKNASDVVMANTTRKIGEKIIYKSTTGVTKNIFKNLTFEFAQYGVISGGANNVFLGGECIR